MSLGVTNKNADLLIKMGLICNGYRYLVVDWGLSTVNAYFLQINMLDLALVS